jgi:hypothetical protein
MPTEEPSLLAAAAARSAARRAAAGPAWRTASSSTLFFLPSRAARLALPVGLIYHNPTLHPAGVMTCRSWFHHVHRSCNSFSSVCGCRLQITRSRAPAPLDGTNATTRPLPCQAQASAVGASVLQLPPLFAANKYACAGSVRCAIKVINLVKKGVGHPNPIPNRPQ